jgi:hypothetical protein
LQLGHIGPQTSSVFAHCHLPFSSETKSGFRSWSSPRAAGSAVRACTSQLC